MPTSRLWDELKEAKASSKYPFKADFWPEGSLQRIITKNDIISELYQVNSVDNEPVDNEPVDNEPVDNELVEFILRDAMKLLATCLISQIRHFGLAQTMCIFRNHNFSDKNLPVEEQVFKRYQFADSLSWSPPQMLNFLQYQWRFVAHTFSRACYLIPRPLPEETILPFIDSTALAQGHFGTVHKVTVHPSHFDHDDPVHQVR